MKVEIEIQNEVIDLILVDSNIPQGTLNEKVQWLWDQIMKRLGEGR